MYKIIIHQPDKTDVNHVTQMIMDNQCKSVDLLQELNPSCFSLTKKKCIFVCCNDRIPHKRFQFHYGSIKSRFPKSSKGLPIHTPWFQN